MTDSPQKHSILVVDDEPSLRMAFSLALTNEETCVSEAADGADALAKLADQPVGVVLMDIRMPNMGGLPAIEELRAQGDLTPVVLCSAHASPEDIQRGLRCGVMDFVAKPVELSHLREVISNVLNPPLTPWDDALDHARHMRFEEALAVLAPLALTDDQNVWADTFRSLARESERPAGFLAKDSGNEQIRRILIR